MVLVQAIRNLDDLETMAVPQKFRQMMTFYKYYSGEAVAPVPTLFSELHTFPPVFSCAGEHGGKS